MDMGKEKTENKAKKSLADKYRFKCARKLAFSKFVQQHERLLDNHHSSEQKAPPGDRQWVCCSCVFDVIKDLHHHVATEHRQEILDLTNDIMKHGCPDARWKSLRADVSPANADQNKSDNEVEMKLPLEFKEDDVFPWLPPKQKISDDGRGKVLLFYKYRQICNTKHVHNWQKELCERLNLKGKIRVATEGINATVAGTEQNTGLYIRAVKEHPLFTDMTDWDFKCSEGGSEVFPEGLKVGIYEEIVPMGISPEKLTCENGGKHLTVDEFHEAVRKHVTNKDADENTVFIDCRNFYESKIGCFVGAVCPDIRKFSYWPEYVDKNKELFKNKNVYMYCTGGIRCERGSAYLMSKGICNNIYQLHGGIHKYIEKYPDGFFRGKLFVFDDRYHITANNDVLSKCSYCGVDWDKYEPCTSSHCHQLVLSCQQCRDKGLTACCSLCQLQHQQQVDNRDRQKKGGVKEECNCTKNRHRVPTEAVLQKNEL